VWIDQVKHQYQFGLETWEALSLLDWGAVSDELLRFGFISKGLDTSLDLENMIPVDLRRFIGAIAEDQRFLSFMARIRDPK
jgi:hypothetical protein